MEITLIEGLNLAFDILEENNEVIYTKINNREKLINNVLNNDKNCLKKFTRNIKAKVEIKCSWKYRLLFIAGYKYCNTCEKILSLNEFGNSNNHKNGIFSICKSCDRKRTKEYRRNNIGKVKESRKKAYNKKKKEDPAYFKRKNALARRRLKQRTPKWITKEEKLSIQDFYANCPEGYHVDHIIPLNGKEVNGLHTITNLQYLTIQENLEKSNKFDIDQFNR